VRSRLPFDHHVSRFREAFTSSRRLLAGERVSFEGSSTGQRPVLLPPLDRSEADVGANARGCLDHPPVRRCLDHVVPPYGNTAGGLSRFTPRSHSQWSAPGATRRDRAERLCARRGGRGSELDAQPSGRVTCRRSGPIRWRIIFVRWRRRVRRATSSSTDHESSIRSLANSASHRLSSASSPRAPLV